MAGESADAMARRHREQAQRLAESARRWQQGADGERATARALAALPPGWIVLHDLVWPGRAHANVDHVVIGPPGVIAVDSKNWSGRITVDAEGLRQNGRDRSAAVWGAESAAYAIADAVPFLARDQARAVVCMVGQDTLSGFVGSVLVVSDAELVPALLARPVILGPREVWDHAEAVRERLGSAADPRPVPPRPARQVRQTPSLVRPAAPPRARVGTRTPSRGRPHRLGARRRPVGVGKAVLAALFLLVLVAQPRLVHSAADEISRRFTKMMEPAAVTPAPAPSSGVREGRRNERGERPSRSATPPPRDRDGRG